MSEQSRRPAGLAGYCALYALIGFVGGGSALAGRTGEWLARLTPGWTAGLTQPGIDTVTPEDLRHGGKFLAPLRSARSTA